MINNRIEIIGCSASGKTTLCNTLSTLGISAVYEPYLKNPFLLKYFDGEQCAFELQICFLLQHFNMLKSSNFENMCVCDYSFELDNIYASLLLTNQEKIIYDHLYNYFNISLGKPHCIIKLVCPDNEIFKRIKVRNRTYENNIDINFLSRLNQEVNSFSNDTYCIEVDSSKINISDVNEVKKHILPFIPFPKY